VGKTIIEKIFASHTEEKEKVKAGETIWLELDVRSARDFGGANVVKNFERHYGRDAELADVKKTFFTFDCVAPANNIPYAVNQQICRVFARKKGVKVYDVDAGIGSHLMIEEGLALPGSTVVGTDSHLNIVGAVCAFGQGMGDQDIAFAFKTGKTWFEVPQTLKINLEGDMPENCSAKDLTLFLVGKLKSKGALGKAIEFYGNAIETLSLWERVTLSSMATEMGAIISLIPPNGSVIEYCKEKARKRSTDFEVSYADEDAEYVEELEFNISELTPQIACPPRPDNVVAVSSLKPVRVDSVFIGSCTNGSYEDIKKVAQIVEGKQVAQGVMAKVAPATRRAYRRLLKEGHLETLYEAGFIIINPGCGGCASGQVGMTGEGEVQISTSNRNFPGKQGMGKTYLASPETAAAAALLGKIGKGAGIEDI